MARKRSYAQILIDARKRGGNWRKFVWEAGETAGEAHDWRHMRNVLETLREEGYNDLAHVYQAGAKHGADARRADEKKHPAYYAQKYPSRDPRKKPRKKAKRKMKKSHPMAPYFAWVKKNHKKFQKADGRLDMKRMWRFWKTHHA